MDQISWYSEATLFTDGHLRRAGTLVQCVRKWGTLAAPEQLTAHIKLSVTVDGLHRIDADQIAALMGRPGFHAA
jgi:hypothetical protein